MDAVRVRFRSVLEWAIAAAFFAATVTVGGMIVRGVSGSNPRVSAAVARETAIPEIPPSVPGGAVSVPVLAFADRKEVRLGETASAIAGRLGHAAETGREEADRGRLGQRLTRFYDYAGFRFVLVLEPFERNGEKRVSAIYLP
jgi:hypothetical protein